MLIFAAAQLCDLVSFDSAVCQATHFDTSCVQVQESQGSSSHGDGDGNVGSSGAVKREREEVPETGFSLTCGQI